MATRVTEVEKELMWRLYQKLGSYKAVAKKVNRSPDTVARHVQNYEAAIQATGYVLNSTQKKEA